MGVREDRTARGRAGLRRRRRRPLDFCVRCAGNRRQGIVRADDGQMTVELAVVIPVVIVVALVAVNAMVFFSQCAQFDRVARDAIRVCAAAPSSGQDGEQVAASVEAIVVEAMGVEGDVVEVTVLEDGAGLSSFEATLIYKPTLFGMGLADEVFGVGFPELKHATTLVVDVYRPGMLL